MCVHYWWCTKHAQLIMGTWPIYKKHFLQLILTKKKNFHLIKYLLATFIFVLSFQSVLVIFKGWVRLLLDVHQWSCGHPPSAPWQGQRYPGAALVGTPAPGYRWPSYTGLLSDNNFSHVDLLKRGNFLSLSAYRIRNLAMEVFKCFHDMNPM